MRTIFILIINLILISSAIKSSSQNAFTEQNDSIELNATKEKNEIQQNKEKMAFYTKKGWILDNIFPEVQGIPDTISNISINYMYFNFDQALLQAYNSKLISKVDFDKYFKKYNLGQTECVNKYVKTFVSIALGNADNNEKYYIIDSNNDCDFSNEKCFPVNENQSFFINSSVKNTHTHKVQYERVFNGKISQDSTWITLEFKGNQLLFYFDEYTSCEFQFDSIGYEIKAFPSHGPVVNYGSPSFFEISNYSDSTIQRRNFNEYVKLSNSYYIISCNADGRKIKLIKEKDAISNGGTQNGMPPIAFNAKNLRGDIIDFPNGFKNKYILLDFWATSCAPCVREITTTYKDLYKKYGTENFEIVGVANNSSSELTSFIDKHKIVWTIIPDGEEKRIQKMYEVYAYPTLFLINPQGNIIAKDMELSGNKLEIKLDELIENK
jgi:peroxiredoxin